MTSFESFFKRLVQAIDVSSQAELARILGIDPAAVTQAKTRGVPKAWALSLAAKFGINPEWLSTGQGPMHSQSNAHIVMIPKVWAKACAGAGSFDVNADIIDELPFERSWLIRKGNPKTIVAMEVIGDSMSPELEPGDNILVDQSQNQIMDNKIYVLGVEDTLQIKRVQTHPGLAILFSTNQRYLPVTLQGDELETLRVVGRVLWSSREY